MGILSFTYNAAKKALRGKNVTPGQAIKKTQVGTKLAFKRDKQDEFVKFRDNLHNSAKFDKATKNKLKEKAPLSKITKKTSEIFTPNEPKLATGGRVGRRLGGGMDMSKRKTNIQKIKEAFGPKSKNKNLKAVDKKKNPGLAKLPIEVRNKMGYAKKGGRA